MRLAAYAGASAALAAAVVVYAFNQRTNFYSANVYLAQSNLCLMILTNLILLCVASFMYTLQRLMYGPLRPIEIEQLYDKAWYAITETALAMTIFREEAGAWFLVMFVALITGKIWGWIGEGRVEVLEQQPPANPRLFHIRLSLSLALSLVYDVAIVVYCARTVIQQARPNMMVMFLFEFAVLTTVSVSTALRYAISLIATRIADKQTQERLRARKAEVRADRARIIREREVAAAAATAAGETPQSEDALEALPDEEDVDEMDIEVPGWEAKGLWVLTLDLVTDLLKLAILLVFFFILLTFYGLPIHIMRDLFITARSFIKRLTAFVKYRRATRDMNSRYPDATVEEIHREDTCIICREEMRAWSVTNPPAEPGAAGNAGTPGPVTNERTRPKKLPCGHVLHLGCLKSWLERQQMCPTCRRPVVDSAATVNQPQANNGGVGAAPNQPPAAAARPRPQMRQFGFGPLRFAFGQANMQDMVQGMNEGRAGNGNGPAPGARVYGLEFGFPRRQARTQATASTTQPSIPEQLQALELRIAQELQALQASQHELHLVTLLNQELERLRRGSEQGAVNFNGHPLPFNLGTNLPLQPLVGQHNRSPWPQVTQSRSQTPLLQRHGALPGTQSIPSGSADLPEGVVLPEGWSLLPLARLDPPDNVATAHVHGSSIPTPTRQMHQSTIPRPSVQSPAAAFSIPPVAMTELLRDALARAVPAAVHPQDTPNGGAQHNGAPSQELNHGATTTSTEETSGTQIHAPTPTRMASEILAHEPLPERGSPSASSTTEDSQTVVTDRSAVSTSIQQNPAESSDSTSSPLRDTSSDTKSPAAIPAQTEPSSHGGPPQWNGGGHPLLSRLQPSPATQQAAPATDTANRSSPPAQQCPILSEGLAPAATHEDSEDRSATNDESIAQHEDAQEMKSKGKGKAVTLEETEDDDAGS